MNILVMCECQSGCNYKCAMNIVLHSQLAQMISPQLIVATVHVLYSRASSESCHTLMWKVQCMHAWQAPTCCCDKLACTGAVAYPCVMFLHEESAQGKDCVSFVCLLLSTRRSAQRACHSSSDSMLMCTRQA